NEGFTNATLAGNRNFHLFFPVFTTLIWLIYVSCSEVNRFLRCIWAISSSSAISSGSKPL
ncbi:MAG: hypothetical protein OEY81_08310, partial [Candidatus Bathyarchaeota archaeon]|nr:hypothetical protein [Candidatus Bathyarchaeota archaeon]